MKKKIYLAHSSKDKVNYLNFIAEGLQQNLDMQSVIFDEFYFNKIENIKDQIIRAIKETSIFVVFLSSNSVESEWVRFEIQQAIKCSIKTIIGINITNINYENYLKKVIGDDVKFTILNCNDNNECIRILLNYCENK